MSERVLKVLLSELTTVRIVCKCGCATEIAVPQAKERAAQYNCLGCGATIEGGAVRLLATQIEVLSKPGQFQIQFVIPEED